MFEPDAEAMPPDQRGQLQLARLRVLVDRLLAQDGVQAGRLRAAGIQAGSDVTTLADLPRLPMTAKSDLWEAYPFGMVGVPAADVVAVHGSSGTGGRPTLVAYTRADLALWARMCARALAAAGATRDSVVHNAYGYGLFTGGLGFHYGAVELGATVVPSSGGMTPRQVTLIRDLRPGHPVLHPVVRDQARRGAGRGGGAAGGGARAQGGHVRRRALVGADAGPDRGPARPAGAGHLRPVRGDRPRGGVRVHRGRGRAARQRGPLPGRDDRRDHGCAGPRRHPRRAGVLHRHPRGAAAAALPDRGHRVAAPRHLRRAAAPW